MANPTRVAPVTPQASGPDRRSFLAAAAAGVVAGPAAVAAPSHFTPVRTLAMVQADEAMYCDSQLHADLCHLVAAIQYARNIADVFWQDHPNGKPSMRCRCRGCASCRPFGGLSLAVERQVLTLLEVALERIAGERCGETDLNGMTYDEMAEDRARLAELAGRAVELWDVERDEDGEVRPWRDDRAEELAAVAAQLDAEDADTPHVAAAAGR